MTERRDTPPQPSSLPMPINTDPAQAIEMAISMLRDIERRAPGTRSFVAYDVFIRNELQPALEALQSETALTKCKHCGAQAAHPSNCCCLVCRPDL